MADASTTSRVTRLSADHELQAPQLKRLRKLAWLLDRSIPIGGYRIGLDPILGLLPGGGDLVTGMLSVVIIYDAARLGLPLHVLARMLGNVLLDSIAGAVPVIGDFFDFVWQANARNLQLVEKHYDPQRDIRPARRIAFAVAAVALILVIGAGLACLFVLAALWKLISGIDVS